MTPEEKLKDYILLHYKSLREFVQTTDVPYSTFDAILKRGIMNSSITNVFKICDALGISADELAHGRIVPMAEKKKSEKDIERLAADLRLDDNSIYFLDKEKLTSPELQLFYNSLDVTIGLIRQQRHLQAYQDRLNEALRQKREKEENEEKEGSEDE